MCKNKMWDNIAPTHEELEQLENLKEVADPTQRLQPIINHKTYYQVLKQWICYKWHIALNLDNESFEDAHSAYIEEMEQLKQGYERDTTLWLELKKGIDNVWLLV